jgi:hypothetical protein
MSHKKRFDWLVLAALALCLLVPGTYLACRKPTPPPAAPNDPSAVQTPAELRDLLAGRGLALNLTALRRAGAGRAAFLHKGERPPQDLEAALNAPCTADAWAGVLLARARADLAPHAKPDDGPCSQAVGGLALFGAPALLDEVRAALRR